ncbi:50S ribosomal protein L25 [Thalassobaculum fulvum]|uniref:Large ribosomal subunit protein bL25 n=1 Tax=Thalassobaculum fulvum TaxID=1633335 RepID=A0A918XU74_9PROT|nr:50S ribosomal protein L25/general stress protein Ctc [Thalassobaculum fulvum]GHD53913.1 50S ribosomal protein L25 [Thalassobaculum fulvum]
MSNVSTLSARARDRVGKGSARAARREGLVPAVIYGDKKDPFSIVLNQRELDKLLKPGFFSHLIDIEVDGQKHRVLPRDLQQHPVTDRALHVDFLRVSATSELTVEVPVEFINDEACRGLRRGGVLNVVRHEIEVYCRADAIPEKIEVDLAGLDIGDSLHISAVKLPDGVRPTIERDFTIATIAAPTLISEEAADAQAESQAAAEEDEEEEE